MTTTSGRTRGTRARTGRAAAPAPSRLRRCDELGATVYELGPGNWLPFHFHHGSEEYLVVLRGRPTLRAGDGSRELAEGEAVHFPRRPDGAHGLANETDEPVRLLMASTLVSPEVAEYPDHKQITAQADGLADRRSALADPRRRAARLLTDSSDRSTITLACCPRVTVLSPTQGDCRAAG